MGSGLKWCKVRLNYYVFGLNAVSGLVRVWGSIRVGMADGGGVLCRVRVCDFAGVAELGLARRIIKHPKPCTLNPKLALA